MEIRELIEKNLQDFAKCDTSLDVCSKWILKVEGRKITHTIARVPEVYEKSYNEDKIDVREKGLPGLMLET